MSIAVTRNVQTYAVHLVPNSGQQGDSMAAATHKHSPVRDARLALALVFAADYDSSDEKHAYSFEIAFFCKAAESFAHKTPASILIRFPNELKIVWRGSRSAAMYVCCFRWNSPNRRVASSNFGGGRCQKAEHLKINHLHRSQITSRDCAIHRRRHLHLIDGAHINFAGEAFRR